MGDAALFGDIIRPAPVQRHIFIDRPDIGCRNGAGEFLLLDHFVGFGVLDAADADDRLDIRRMGTDNIAGADKELCDFRIVCALVECEPVSGRLVIDAQEHSAVGL